MDFQLEGACEKCSHRRTCRVPCTFVKKYLSQDNPAPFELKLDEIIIVYPKSRREIQRTVFETFKDGTKNQPAQHAFSSENESAFLKEMSPPRSRIVQPITTETNIIWVNMIVDEKPKSILNLMIATRLKTRWKATSKKHHFNCLNNAIFMPWSWRRWNDIFDFYSSF